MRFHADLHIHSKYSRATSRDLDLEHLSQWAGRKGVALVGTGDFTHPAWRAELKDKLVHAEPGLFRLRSDIEQAVARDLPPACQNDTRFMLTVEISTIYKKGDRVRKIHHLLYAPDFDTADRISASLARIGNIASDGRPILGLDSRHLLEITLESHPDAYLIPAHIWTPWFATLGSQSGFDSITECYGDLADRIFAVETGLSSDPGMNWRLSMLDRYRLVSNSDAHSPGKIGREATTFDTDLDYFAIKRALETGDGYVGTVEFFPEEGKYHLDGHRKCDVRFTPEETRAHDTRCPVCGQPVTVGVLHRVHTLADRTEAEALPPATAGEVSNLVALPEILSELLASGPATKTVARTYDRLIGSLGAELSILDSVPVEDIARASSPLMAEAITRLRAGQVIRESGYDGEYGVIRLFDESELREKVAGASLFGDTTPLRSPRASKAAETKRTTPAAPRPAPPPSPVVADGLDDDQQRVVEIVTGPIAIVAGPGSGKTRTLTHRIADLVARHGVPADACLAITFTRRAAAELQERLGRLLPDAAPIAVHTFHSLGLTILREHGHAAGVPADFQLANEADRASMLSAALGVSITRAERLLRAISRAKRGADTEAMDTIGEAYEAYHRELAARHWLDFDDLIVTSAQALDADAAVANHWRQRFRWISVDEFQDVDPQQYRLITLLAPPPEGNLCVIGDPNQAIYGFRGADASCFERFAGDYPSAATIRLARNYRSTGTIVTASSQVIASAGHDDGDAVASMVRDMHERITIHTAPTDRDEAEFVARTIERLMGGHSLHALDTGLASGGTSHTLGFSDFAVLYRTSAQAEVLAATLDRAGVPFMTHSHDPLSEQPAVRALLDEWKAGEDVSAAAERLARRDNAPDAASLDSARHHLRALEEAHAGDRARVLDAVALATSADFRDPRAERVSLLTLHAAKGLEFPVVFITGLEDGVLPLYWDQLDAATAAEERRLFYVGMTRAKDRLFLSRAAQRRWRGALRTFDASPFLLDIEQALVKHQHADSKPQKPEDRQLKLL